MKRDILIESLQVNKWRWKNERRDDSGRYDFCVYEDQEVYADEFGRMLGNETYSPNEISILLFLANNPSIDTNSQLCTCLGVSKALVCRSVDALLGKEMIISVADDHDKRVQHLKLTEHALPVIEQLGGIKRKIDQEILEGIPEEDIANMANTMEKIFARFEERAKGKESSL